MKQDNNSFEINSNEVQEGEPMIQNEFENIFSHESEDPQETSFSEIETVPCFVEESHENSHRNEASEEIILPQESCSPCAKNENTAVRRSMRILNSSIRRGFPVRLKRSMVTIRKLFPKRRNRSKRLRTLSKRHGFTRRRKARRPN